MNSVEIREARPGELSQAFALRFRRYRELGWIKDGDCPDGQETDKYDAHSVHFVAVEDGHVKGYVRLILSGHGLLPMEEEFGQPLPNHLGLQDGEGFCPGEVSRFIVEKNGTPIHAMAQGLLQVLIRYSIHHGVTHWYQALDRLAFRLVKSWHFLFCEYAPRKFYMGSQTVPTVLPAQRFLNEMREYDQEKYNFFSQDIPPDQIVLEAQKAYLTR
jgi:N-acyl-L-homoserine lactone synthetase